KDSNSGNIQDYFLDKIEKECNFDTSTNKNMHHAQLKDDYLETIEELKGDLVSSSILKLLVWAEGKILISDISKLLFTFQELANIEVVKEKLLKLVKNKNIEIISKPTEELLEVKILKSTINFLITRDNLPFIANFSDNTSRQLRNKKSAGMFNSGFIVLTKLEFDEAIQRMSALRNWLLEVEKNSAPKTNKELLFQYDLNLGSIINFRELGIESLKDWKESSES
ncbi:MAG: hypothetical protein Q7U04_06415, partial [Bacteriovorax sp.]|nr:hypothetical protein [Bacteriovorax sp.]